MAVVLAGAAVACKSSKDTVATPQKRTVYQKVRVSEEEMKEAVESGSLTLECYDAEGNKIPCSEVYDENVELPWLVPSQRRGVNEFGDTVEIENLNQVFQYQLQEKLKEEQQKKQ